MNKLQNKDYCRAYRERKKAMGLKEIRNVYAKPEHHPLVENYVKSLLEQDSCQMNTPLNTEK